MEKARTVPHHYKALYGVLFKEAKGSLEGREILEVGAAEGFFIRFLRGGGVGATGIDLKPKDVVEGAVVLECDARNLAPLGSQKFDFIISNDVMSLQGLTSHISVFNKHTLGMGTFEKWADETAHKIHEELLRHLKPGGAIIHVTEGNEKPILNLEGLPLVATSFGELRGRRFVVLRKA